MAAVRGARSTACTTPSAGSAATPDAAVEVVESSALDLVEVVATRPETVEDAVGWWFARARALGRRVATRSADLPLGGGVLSADEDQPVLAEALEELPERERVALLLRDSYDLPATSVGAALGTDADGAMELVGRARLAFLPAGRRRARAAVPGPPERRSARSPGSARAAPVAAARRDRPPARAVLRRLPRRRRTASSARTCCWPGSTVVALPEARPRRRARSASRSQAYGRAAHGRRARARPSEEEEWDDDEDRRGCSRRCWRCSALVLAVLLGLGLGLLLTPHRRVGVSCSARHGELRPGVQLLPPPSRAPPAAGRARRRVPAPRAARRRVFVIPPSPPPSPSPTAAPSPGAAAPSRWPHRRPGVRARTARRSPSRGTGWAPGSEVLLDYLDPTGAPTGSRAVATPDAPRRASPASSPRRTRPNLPGRHAVRATDGDQRGPPRPTTRGLTGLASRARPAASRRRGRRSSSDWLVLSRGSQAVS